MYKFAFIFITLIHGLIHFTGFSKAFDYGTLPPLIGEMSKPLGILWFLVAILFVLGIALYLFKKDRWTYFVLMAVFISQILIINNWQEAKFGTIANVIILLTAILGLFQIKFKKIYKDEVKTGFAQNQNLQNSNLTETEIAFLPHAVKKYLRYTGSVGKPKVNNFKAFFYGKIRKNGKSDWMKLSSEQYNFIKKPTRLFYFDAITKFMPVSGFRCFKNGTALIDIRLLSMFKEKYQSDYEMDIYETVTFFNDMCVMAPAALIDKRIEWSEVGRNIVRASFTNNGVTVSALLYFNEKGELVNFVSGDRYSIGENGIVTKYIWTTPLRDYKSINGYKLASYAETIYTYPDGDFTYATSTLKNIKYNLTE